MKISVRQLTYAALLLALCVGAQQLKGFSQYVTGPLVNATLILAALLAGLWGGLAIAVLSPVFAFLIAPFPIVQAVPQMLPLIMLGNVVIALCAGLLREKKRLPLGLTFGLALGAVLKPLTLFLGVRFVILPYFAAGLPAPMKTMLTAMFSVNQLVTAAVGSVVAFGVYQILVRTEALKTID